MIALGGINDSSDGKSSLLLESISCPCGNTVGRIYAQMDAFMITSRGANIFLLQDETWMITGEFANVCVRRQQSVP